MVASNIKFSEVATVTSNVTGLLDLNVTSNEIGFKADLRVDPGKYINMDGSHIRKADDGTIEFEIPDIDENSNVIPNSTKVMKFDRTGNISFISREYAESNGTLYVSTESNETVTIDGTAGGGGGGGTFDGQPPSHGTTDLGAVNNAWNNLYLTGSVNIVSGPTTAVITPTDWQTIKNYVLSAQELGQTGGPTDIKIVRGGNSADHTAYIVNGKLYTLGKNTSGQLGIGNTVDTTVPIPVITLSGTVIDVAVGNSFTVIVMDDGTAKAAGLNNVGQLGDGTTTDRTVFVDVVLPGGFNARRVACGHDHVLFLGYDVDGNGDPIDNTRAVYGFGSNASGQLGTGTANASNTTAVQFVMPEDPNNAPNLYLPAAVASGPLHSVVITTAGTLVGAGSNADGRLGADPVSFPTVPTPALLGDTSQDGLTFTPLTQVIAVDCGTKFTAVLRLDGDIKYTGTFHTLTSTAKTFDELVAAGTAESGGSMLLATGSESLFYVDTTGVLRGIGADLGQVGPSATLVTIDSYNKQVTSIAAYESHMLAVLDNANAYALGDNTYGQLSGSVASYPVLTLFYEATASTGDFPIVSAGADTMIIQNDTVYSTEEGCAYILRQHDQSKDIHILYVRHTSSTTVALLSDGTMWAWGQNQYGMVGNGVADSLLYPIPQKVTVIENVVAFDCGSAHIACIKEDGQLWSWGYNGFGQLANGNTGSYYTPQKATGGAATSYPWIQVACGAYHTVVINRTSSGASAFSVGYNFNGQLGIGNTTNQSTLAQMSSVGGFCAKVACGSFHTLILTNYGEIYSCGHNTYGQLGHNDTSNRSTPAAVTPGGTVGWERYKNTDITCGAYYSMAIQDGKVYNCGYNGWGQLGLNNTSTQQSFTLEQSGITTARKIAASGSTSYVLLEDGTVKASGRNTQGQLGDGTYTQSLLYVSVSGISNVVDINGNKYDEGVSALLEDGSVYAWGGNAQGQLGNGTSLDINTPYKVITTEMLNKPKITQISDSKGGNPLNNHKLALMNDGTVLAAGSNSKGQLGDDSTDSRPGEFIRTKLAIKPTNLIARSQYQTFIVNEDGTTTAYGRTVYNATGISPWNGISYSNYSGNVVDTAFLPDTPVSIACAYSHVAAVMPDGTVRCWGYNGYGQLGDGTTSNRTTESVQVLGITNATKVACGYYHTVVLCSDGSVKCFGYNGYGQLGDGTTTQRTTPVTAIASGAVDIAAGPRGGSSYGTSYAVMSDGTVRGWGYNGSGQLGVGSTSSVYSPATMSGITTAVQVSCAYAHALILLADGTCKAVGYNNNGELGDGSTTQRTTPVTVSGVSDIIKVEGNGNSSIFLTSTGAVYGCGYNNYYNLGYSATSSNQAVPVLADVFSSYTVTDIFGTGYIHNIMIYTDDKKLITKGESMNYGESGHYGNLGQYDVFQFPPKYNDLVATQVSAGDQFSAALLPDNTIRTWGTNDIGQLGYASGIAQSEVPVEVRQVLDAAVSVATNYEHSLALMSDGTVYAWGNNTYGQLGNTVNNGISTANPVTEVQGLGAGVIGVAAGSDTSFALMSDGTVKAWGWNQLGELGSTTNNSTSNPNPTPTTISGLNNVTKIVAGHRFTAVLLSDNTVKTFGLNNYGQLGSSTNNGTNNPNPTPTTVSGLSGVTDIETGENQLFALLSDGTIKACGANNYGELGNSTDNGTWTANPTPTTISGLTNVSQVSAGKYHVIACLTDGTVKAWGRNMDGALGSTTNNGTNNANPTPTTISSLSAVSSVYAGGYHSLAIMSDGTAKGWGYSNRGQIGITNNTNPSPLTISGLNGITELIGGNYHTIALNSGGNIKALGSNQYGELGIATNSGTTNANPTPTTISDIDPVTQALSNFTQVACGRYHALALLTDGTVMSWGRNTEGQLGDGTNTSSTQPVLVSGLTDVTAVSCGHYHSIALLDDGTVKTWGLNTNGQLGNGTTTDSNTPVVATGVTNVIAISAGASHTLALLSSGIISAWGSNHRGQLGNGAGTGDGTTLNSTSAVTVSGITDAVQISTGNYHSVAVLANGTTKVWGYNDRGQLANGVIGGTGYTTPANVKFAWEANVVTNRYKLGTIMSSYDSGVETSLNNHVIVQKNDNTAFHLGHNDYGQGMTGNTDSLITKLIQTHNPVNEVSFFGETIAFYVSDIDKTFAVTTQGHIYGVGYAPSYYTMGTGAATVNTTTPVRIDPGETLFSSGNKCISLASDDAGTVAVREDGSVVSWGTNTYYQLGNTTTSGSITTPTLCVPGMTGAVEVVCTRNATFIRTNTGDVYAGGILYDRHTGWSSSYYNNRSFNGYRESTNTQGFVSLSAELPASPVVSISAGNNHVAIVTQDGKVYTMGHDLHGQLGLTGSWGEFQPYFRRVHFGNTKRKAVKVVCGFASTMVIMEDGSMFTFGRTDDQKRGTWEVPRLRATNVIDVASMSLTQTSTANQPFGIHNGAIYYIDAKNVNRVHAFGGDDSSLVPNYGFKSGFNTSLPGNQRTTCFSGSGITNITFVESDGTVKQWGDNANRALGLNSFSGAVFTPTVNTWAPANVVAACSGTYHSLMLTSDGTLYGCGYNGGYELSGIVPQSNYVNTPTSMSSWFTSSYKIIGANSQTTFAVRASDGVIEACGNGGTSSYLLGQGSTGIVQGPVTVSSVTGCDYLSCSIDGNYAIRGSDGVVWYWGYMGNYKAGNGSTSQYSTPQSVGYTYSDVVQIGQTYYGGYFVMKDGRVKGVGSIVYDRLGNRSFTTAQYLEGMTNVSMVACGFYHVLFLMNDGTIESASNSNSYGQLGLGNNLNNNKPEKIPGLTNIVAVAASYNNSYALSADGTLWGWGRNLEGQLGIPKSPETNWQARYSPVKISGVAGEKVISGFLGKFVNFTGQHRCFVKDLQNKIDSALQKRSLEGLLVVADTDEYQTMESKNEISIAESLPIVRVSSKAKDKNVFGVICYEVNDQPAESLTEQQLDELKKKGDTRVEINSIGEGAVWVCDINGPLESGDYITTSDLPGYGMKQDDDLLRNSTAAKITMNCDFNPPMIPKMVPKYDENMQPLLNEDGSIKMVEELQAVTEEVFYAENADGTRVKLEGGLSEYEAMPVPGITVIPVMTTGYFINDEEVTKAIYDASTDSTRETREVIEQIFVQPPEYYRKEPYRNEVIITKDVYDTLEPSKRKLDSDGNMYEIQEGYSFSEVIDKDTYDSLPEAERGYSGGVTNDKVINEYYIDYPDGSRQDIASYEEYIKYPRPVRGFFEPVEDGTTDYYIGNKKVSEEVYNESTSDDKYTLPGIKTETVMIPKYQIRYVDSTGKILSGEEEYNTKKSSGESVYKAAFVGCTYHCG